MDHFFICISCLSLSYCLCVTCSLVVTCWKLTDLLDLLCVMFFLCFVTFPFSVMGQMWHLIVSVSSLLRNVNMQYIITEEQSIKNNIYYEMRRGLGSDHRRRKTIPVQNNSEKKIFRALLYGYWTLCYLTLVI